MPKTKLFVSTLLSLLISALGFGLVQATDTATVTATVTVQNISVTVTDGNVAYGTLATSSTYSTSQLGDSQIATNNGNIVETLNIKGQNSDNWTLAATIGADQYKHAFCTASCSVPTNFTALTTNYTTLASNISAG